MEIEIEIRSQSPEFDSCESPSLCKPAVAIGWLLAATLWVGYVGYSVLEGMIPFAMASTIPIALRQIALPITEFAIKAVQTRDEDLVSGLGGFDICRTWSPLWNRRHSQTLLDFLGDR